MLSGRRLDQPGQRYAHRVVEIGVGEAVVQLLPREHALKRADHWDAIGKPKSKSSRRTVPIGPELVSELRRWKVACAISPLDLVFPTSVGTVDHQNMRRGLWVVMVKVAW